MELLGLLATQIQSRQQKRIKQLFHDTICVVSSSFERCRSASDKFNVHLGEIVKVHLGEIQGNIARLIEVFDNLRSSEIVYERTCDARYQELGSIGLTLFKETEQLCREAILTGMINPRIRL